jgi:hypothetical protein
MFIKVALPTYLENFQCTVGIYFEIITILKIDKIKL